MTEQRLKEIKDSIDFQLSVCDIPEYETSKLLAEEELELYNEVVRLRKIIDNYNDIKKELLDYIDYHEYCRFGDIDGGEADEMREILNKGNLTLEQLTGIAND